MHIVSICALLLSVVRVRNRGVFVPHGSLLFGMRCVSAEDLYNYTIDVFHESAMQWLEEAAKGEEPFFLYVRLALSLVCFARAFGT